MRTTPIPPIKQVTWLGGRQYKVEDLRALPGRIAFMVTDEGRTSQVRVLKDTELETEIAALL
jgi:hypothetical protein